MGFEDEVERSFRRPCRRQVQADMRTHLIHRRGMKRAIVALARRLAVIMHGPD